MRPEPSSWISVSRPRPWPLRDRREWRVIPPLERIAFAYSRRPINRCHLGESCFLGRGDCPELLRHEGDRHGARENATQSRLGFADHLRLQRFNFLLHCCRREVVAACKAPEPHSLGASADVKLLCHQRPQFGESAQPSLKRLFEGLGGFSSCSPPSLGSPPNDAENRFPAPFGNCVSPFQTQSSLSEVSRASFPVSRSFSTIVGSDTPTSRSFQFLPCTPGRRFALAKKPCPVRGVARCHLILHPSSFIFHPSSFIFHPSSRGGSVRSVRHDCLSSRSFTNSSMSSNSSIRSWLAEPCPRRSADASR